jgi:hypothetical protein
VLVDSPFASLAILGANVLDDEPFIIMELHENGNALDFLKRNPDKNRLALVRGRDIWHGDLFSKMKASVA